ncbi:hypothetical protein BJY24_005160 [Nocardia transvalensis]|uniref:Uncharacterized protein n=1 Tax=Nocardia transvalensis TaxID=37333 RepID=A0A7W9UK81_9NOCA|nr:hypothetical protein [Nocardia transvalensis]MBB5916248.1 hypothetical protein [Nocardia transvalensis]
MTLAHPTAPPTGDPGGVACDNVRLLARIDDPAHWQARVGCLLASGRRRWLGRTEFDAGPLLRQWNRVRLPYTPPGHPTLRSAVAAAVAGAEIPGTPLTEFAAAIMLLSGCTAVVTVPAGVPDRRRAVSVSLFAFPADDLALARDLAGVTLDAAGVVTTRRETTVFLAARPLPGARARRDQRLIVPNQERCAVREYH